MTDLDRYLDDFGDRLRGAEPPPRRRGIAFVALAGVAALIVAVVVAIAPGGGARPVDAVAAARAALLAPADEIVYMRVRSGSGKSETVSEQWTAQAPKRWRWVYRYPPTSHVYDADGPVRGRFEMAYAGGRQGTYVRGRNTLRVLTDLPDDGPHARMPSLVGNGGVDPEMDLRAMLASGKLVDTGEVQAGGRSVRRLVSDTTSRGIRRVVTYDVDPQTFAPLGGSFSITGPHGHKPPGYRFTVERYERIPITAETAKLLTIKTNARTKVTELTVPEFREQIQKDRRRSAGRRTDRDR